MREIGVELFRQVLQTVFEQKSYSPLPPILETVEKRFTIINPVLKLDVSDLHGTFEEVLL
jgi:hypothetical protein